ncbi:DUF2750 domain-containing protein [Hahella ganghwensis]|uniref:DUF2750 domain-containing protein n=1 Tax=Hahella ganghwensis TaxID=286420 RepID=UPI00035D1C91|nr:DUF2750 domain-containing protein [Hahella ganghwensis]
MNQNDLNNILGLNCEERFDYFLMDVVESKDIWILVNEDDCFLKLYSEEEDLEYLPVWPSKDFASHYASETDKALSPKSISLPHFLNKWIPGLKRDELFISVFPTATDTSIWMMSPDELNEELKNELSNMG